MEFGATREVLDGSHPLGLLGGKYLSILASRDEKPRLRD